ncbi:MAG: hypothetical protein K2M17_04080 [Bacilli bacterium]|nr:hypothetical protein [Bacilli bacterium]
MPTYKHATLPVYQTKEFDFFRCVQFDDSLYYKTASELHNGNLRVCSGRYAKLFPNQKLSYWANSSQVARAEVKKHGATNNLFTVWAYDDNSSFIPTVLDREELIIVDGRQAGVQDIIDKVDNEQPISTKEQKVIDEIMALNPDCLVFDSHALKGGENFIFFEKGFKKLSLRQVKLSLGGRHSRSNYIFCAGTCDYMPYLESYGDYFMPILKTARNEAYTQSEEYQLRKRGYDQSWQRFHNWEKERSKKCNK